MTAARRARVLAADEVRMQPVPGANASCRVPISRATTGCQNLIQRVFRFGAGTSPEMLNQVSEDVLFVVSGSGQAEVGGQAWGLAPATGVLVPPGWPYRIRNPGPQPLEVVSVLSPQPEHPDSVPPSAQARPVGKLTVHESEEQPLPAGDDRYFKLMIDPRYGCKYLTQFIGFIEKSRAPFHAHTYEEVIYILDGEGILHLEAGDFPLRAGSSVYLPPGTSHCLENSSEGVLRLLGVFCPAGSPAAKSEAEPSARPGSQPALKGGDGLAR